MTRCKKRYNVQDISLVAVSTCVSPLAICFGVRSEGPGDVFGSIFDTRSARAKLMRGRLLGETVTSSASVVGTFFGEVRGAGFEGDSTEMRLTSLKSSLPEFSSGGNCFSASERSSFNCVTSSDSSVNNLTVRPKSLPPLTKSFQNKYFYC